MPSNAKRISAYSIPTACFFQNLRCPSAEAVATKLVLPRLKFLSVSHSSGTDSDNYSVPCYGDLSDSVSVHKRLGVSVRRGQLLKKELLVRQDCSLLASVDASDTGQAINLPRRFLTVVSGPAGIGMGPKSSSDSSSTGSTGATSGAAVSPAITQQGICVSLLVCALDNAEGRGSVHARLEVVWSVWVRACFPSELLPRLARPPATISPDYLPSLAR